MDFSRTNQQMMELDSQWFDTEEVKEEMAGSKVGTIKEFYKDQTVFITGATGYLGTLLVEKLLRSCPQIRKLILLVRSRGSESIEDRVQNLFGEDVFDSMRLANPNYSKKVDIVCGRLDDENFGLSSSDTQLLLSQTTVVFHVAATVRFDEHIRIAYNVNVRGTETALSLAKRMKRLKSFVYVSTAYSNCDQKYIDEKFYPPSFTNEELSRLISSASDEELAVLNELILDAKPNTYTLTKAMAEDLVRKATEELPVCVFRPSIVMPTLEEPLPLWIKGFNGILALSVAIGSGFLRVLLIDTENSTDMVPGDRTINALTTLAWYRTTLDPSDKDRVVFNYVSYNDNRVHWKEYLQVCIESLLTGGESSDDIVWKPGYTTTRYSAVFKILFYLYHFIPAIVFAMAENLSHRKPRIMKAYRKIFFLTRLLHRFTLTEFEFGSENTRSMVKAVSDVDKKQFDSSISNFRWSTMFVLMHHSGALYFLKNPLTKAHYQSYAIYIDWTDCCARLLIKAGIVYFILYLLANLINFFSG